jgi:outer membrane protein assembly factor BamB
MDLLGTTFAGYEVHRLIMRTALLSLYHALRPIPDLGEASASRNAARPVALWVSDRLDHRASPVIRDFIKRAELSAAIEHPAIAPVLDLDEAEGRVYFVTPATTARTFDELIRRGGPMPADQAIGLLADVADGLDTAHAAGLTHGALSPATIWVGGTPEHDLRAYLVGFGLEALLRARARGDHRDSLLDDVAYIAPEQLRSDDGGSDRADQYALACALYHCVTGAPPFVRDRTSALFGAHMLARPTPPLSGDSAFDEAVLTGMAKDPEERFDSCVALLEAAAGRPITRPARHGEDERQRAGGLPPPDERDRQPAGGFPPPDERDRQPAGGFPPPAGRQTPDESVADERRDEDVVSVADAPAPFSFPVMRPDDMSTRRRPSRAWVAWLAGGVLVLVIFAGAATLIIGMLTRDADDGQERARQAAAAPAAAAPAESEAAESEAAESEAAATVAWQRDIGEGAVTHLGVEEANAVAATGNNLTVVNPITGSRRWRKVADVGILTDLVTIGDVLVYRTDVLSGVSLPYGIQLWESDDVPAAPGGLSIGGSDVYAIGPGRILPELAAVDPRSGEERWHFHGHDARVDLDAAVGAGDDLVAILQRRVMFGIDPQREPEVTAGGSHVEIEDEKWRTEVDDPWIESLATSDTEAVFALQNGSVCAHALTDGREQWCTQVNGVRDGTPGLLVRNETVLVVSPVEMVALDLSSGEELWQVEASEPFLPLVAVDGGLVYTADDEGAIHTYAMGDGTPQWDAGGLGDITALEAADGGVIVGTEDGVLARIEPGGGSG